MNANAIHEIKRQKERIKVFSDTELLWIYGTTPN